MVDFNARKSQLYNGIVCDVLEGHTMPACMTITVCPESQIPTSYWRKSKHDNGC